MDRDRLVTDQDRMETNYRYRMATNDRDRMATNGQDRMDENRASQVGQEGVSLYYFFM